MFQQPISYGPGTGTFLDHTFEILVMLSGAFLIGLWLGWLIWSRYQKGFEQSRRDMESHAATALTLRTQVEELKTRIHAADTESAGLKAELSNLTWENAEFRKKLDGAGQEIDAAKAQIRRLETELALAGKPADNPDLPAQPDSPIDEWLPADAPDEEPWIPQTSTMEPGLVHDFANILDEAVDNGVAALDLSLFHTPALEPPGEKPDALFSDALAEPSSPEHPLAGRQEGTDATPIPPPPGFRLMEFDAGEEPADDESTGHMEHLTAKGAGLPPLDIPDLRPDFEEPDTPPFTAKGIAAEEPFESPVLPEPEPLVLPLLRDEQPQDLKIVEGIGPKIESLLNKNGIRTYQELAAAPVERLRAILTEAGTQYAMHDPGTWSAQALLAANGEWENLKAYQAFLDAGKRPK